MNYQRTRLRIAIPLVILAPTALVACGAALDFKPTPRSYDLHCGAETCPTYGFACTLSQPVRCEYIGTEGANRDGGK